MNRPAIIAFALIAMSSCSRPAANSEPAPPAPSQVEAMIQRSGAHEAIVSLDAPGPAPSDWQLILNAIERGDEAWLRLVPQLRAGADGDRAVALRRAVSHALPKNARGVLRLTGSDYPIDEICRSNDENASGRQERAFRNGARGALNVVDDPELQAAKTACLDLLGG